MSHVKMIPNGNSSYIGITQNGNLSHVKMIKNRKPQKSQKSCLNKKKICLIIFLFQILFIIYSFKTIMLYILPSNLHQSFLFDQSNVSRYFRMHVNDSFLSKSVFRNNITCSVDIIIANNHQYYPSDILNIAGIVPNSIAIGLAITSKGNSYVNKNEIRTTFPFFKSLLPSFCSTASEGYYYNIFLAHDNEDTFFNKENHLRDFIEITVEIIYKNCPRNSNYTLHFIKCKHSGKPARAQNDAMMEAYMLNMEYYYRVNDDSYMHTGGWTEAFIATLKAYNPPNVGVVGPHHSGGHEGILTYDFVHFTHIQIFGYYYPRIFTGWFADNWITDVYSPGKCTKLAHIRLRHTLEIGTRYVVDMSARNITTLVEEGKKIINKYINALKSQQNKSLSVNKVISMSLSEQEPRYTYGAVRNAQLLPVYFPNWKLRIYIPGGTYNARSIPLKVLNKLKFLNVQLVKVSSIYLDLSPKVWKYFILDDKKVTSFLIRNTDNRFSEHFQALVTKWTANETLKSCFYISDANQSVQSNLIDGFIGCKNQIAKNNFKDSIRHLAFEVKEIHKENEANNFVENYVWPKIRNNSMYIDYKFGGNFTGMFSSLYKTRIRMHSSFNEYDEEING